MALGKRSADYSTPVVLPDGETIRVAFRTEDGEVVYALGSGQAPGILDMMVLLQDIQRELQVANTHLAAITGEQIA
ncbi:unnamed protein product, partial [marine sediment metagenome]